MQFYPTMLSYCQETFMLTSLSWMWQHFQPQQFP